MTTKRYDFIEVLRIIACFLVIVNHTEQATVVSVASASLPMWLGGLGYLYISRVAVPVFLMITGYTMLSKEDGYKKILNKVSKNVCVLVVFSALYEYIYIYIIGIRVEIELNEFFQKICNGPITNAFWYLYLYIGILLMMPFLQKLIRTLSKRDFHYFFLISIVIFSVCPVVEHLNPDLAYSKYMELPIFANCLCYLFLGHYFKTYVVTSKKGLIISLLLFIFVCVYSVKLSYEEALIGGNYFFYTEITFWPILVESICIFYMAMFIPQLSGNVARLVSMIGGCTFGIYLLGDMLIEIIRPVYLSMCENDMNPFLAVTIFDILIFLCGLILTLFLKRVPGIKKLV